MAIRKDANTLTTAEKQEFVQAVHTLKQSGLYDQFVLRHANTPMTAIHRSPAFLPWHRRFILDFERELQRVSGNPNLGLPYWNWPNGGPGASMWNDDLLGGDGNSITGIVETGPFRSGQWSVINSDGNATGPLRRRFGQSGASTLPTQSEILQVLGVTPYDSFPWNISSSPSFRNQLEGWTGPNLHNRGHVWVGGSMLPMTSPNDPVFFMHHCMVDKLWHEWQLRFPNQGYLPVSGGPFGQNLTDAMAGTPNGPVGSRPIDMLDSTALGIEYDQLLPGTPQPTPPGQNVTQLNVNALPVSGQVSQPGEIDLFEFELDQRRNIILETSGNSDTVLTLYGPDDFTREIAVNDDGGSNFNSRISMTLSAGTYRASVRLYNPSRTGEYQIQLSSETGTPTPSIPLLTVDNSPFAAEISTDRESDVYQINITTAGRFQIETQGDTDVFLSVYGPDSQSTLIATDDDSGIGLNSRLILELNPGGYFAAVRHFSAFGRGAYQIRVVRLS
ncbi:DVUA0089 family protein [Nitrosomonas sp.]|uniref:DVUA0089 family protein n=1 Tax=Nitrosomonas sp. TaxID=42353 RepID=UPI00284568AE|nr:DVUA0089 family protein [Nitrosomonas sp.]MCP5243777.1 DVUA0089 family protein [Burkholderiales bacterium]MDR4515081.1 tyrosinase family protein [Nitrosomonas sp.]